MSAPRPARRGRVREDAGAVAILVALTVSTVLLGVAALAVDAGQVYLRKDSMQAAADLAAMAGAAHLPDVDRARSEAVRAVCDPLQALPDWLDGTICPRGSDDDDSAWRAHDWQNDLPGWATNADPSDGAIVVYGDDADGSGRYEDAERLPAGAPADTARALRVVLPPTTVEFGLARSVGATSLTLSKAATARIGTPVGVGILPFAARAQDTAPGTDHRFCVKDPAATGVRLARPPAPAGPLPILLQLPFDRSLAPGETLPIRRWLIDEFPSGQPAVHVLPTSGGTRRPLPIVSHDRYRIDVRIPPGLTAGSYYLWAEWGTRISYSTTIFVTTGGTPATQDPCLREDSERGVLDIGRRTQDGAAAAQQVLAQNLKTGIQPTPHRYDEYPDGLLDPVLNPVIDLLGARCGDILGLVPLLSALDLYRPDINCARNRPAGFAAGLTTGLLDDDGDSPGRLQRSCSGADAPAGAFGSIDGTDLFSPDSPLVDRRISGGADLATALVQEEPRRGWITAKAFRCPRLGLVPVMNPDIPAQAEDNPILGFTYAWIEDDESGVVFTPGRTDQIQAVRAYAIDPGWFPETVSGSPNVTDYLGPDFPKQAQLVPDVSDP